jgi:hypothetical protein
MPKTVPRCSGCGYKLTWEWSYFDWFTFTYEEYFVLEICFCFPLRRRKFVEVTALRFICKPALNVVQRE